MKKLIIIALLTSFLACKKEEVKPKESYSKVFIGTGFSISDFTESNDTIICSLKNDSLECIIKIKEFSSTSTTIKFYPTSKEKYNYSKEESRFEIDLKENRIKYVKFESDETSFPVYVSDLILK